MKRVSISRRIFLQLWAALFSGFAGFKLYAAGIPANAPLDTEDMTAIKNKRIGLALGAGGANGLSHILMLDVFDELGIKPYRISGSSIGAVIGALYASGNSAKYILKIVDNMVVRENDTWKEAFLHKGIFNWIEFLDPEIGKGDLISGNAFLSFLYKKINILNFEELKIPLSIVATDFWTREQVVVDSGSLLPALQGSMAIPGLFSPVKFNDRILVDGGLVNPVPYDVLFDDCDFIVAIDVIGEKSRKAEPSFLDSIFNTFLIMQQSILNEKLKLTQPNIYIRPKIVDIRALEFHKIDDIFKQARQAKEELKESLRKALGAEHQNT